MRTGILLFVLGTGTCVPAASQMPASAEVAVTLGSLGAPTPVPALAWLMGANGTSVAAFVPHGKYVLAQKNRLFQPHVQVVPVGASVDFPNRDPFFHNVFSLFDGKRFDLGLYEAGSSKTVTFPREGVSYIFCNIHPEMSAVIIALSSPLFALGKTGDRLVIHKVPLGDYELNVWIEGAQGEGLKELQRPVHVGSTVVDLGEIVSTTTDRKRDHNDKFGKPYPKESRPSY